MQVRTVRLLECLRHSLYPDGELTFLNDVGGNSVRAQRQKENECFLSGTMFPRRDFPMSTLP